MLVDVTTAEFAVLLFGTLAGTLFAALVVAQPGWSRPRRRVPPEDDAVSFLFHGLHMTDASGAATVLADDVRPDDRATEDAWHALRRKLVRRFGDLPDRPEEALDTGEDTSRSDAAVDSDDPGRLIFSRAGDAVRITLIEDAPQSLDRQLGIDVNRELRFLRTAIADAPNPVWAMDEDATVTWHNRAYRKLAQQVGMDTDPKGPFGAFDPAEAVTSPRRVPLRDRDSETSEWYEVSTRVTHSGYVAYAVNVDAVIRAEQAQRNFVQTLTKTFAHLSTGLAVFDRSQRLALFNPALVDLTGVPAEFLTARPSLAAFFDYLRDHQVMPEPKNYPDWRERIGAVIAAARDGRYCRTWNLASGLTYRVTGKPHPDGAVAFLFEDISAEVSLTRRFRAELETSQAVLDRQDRALAVFSQMGILTFSNEAFRQMWKFDPDSSFAETTISDTLKIWQSECAVSPVWDGLSQFVSSFGERTARRARVTHETLGALDFCAEPLPGGATLMSFRQVEPEPGPAGGGATVPLPG